MAERHFYEFGPFRLEDKGKLLFRDGQVVSLPPKAVDTLLLLVQNAGSVVEKEEILKQVWQGAFVEEGSLTRTVSVLRKTLGEGEEGQEFIATVPKRGYRLVAPVKIVDGIEAARPEAAPKIPPTSLGTKRKWTTVALAGLLLLAVVAYFAATLWWKRGPQERRMIAVLPFQNLTGDSSKDFVSDGLTEEMITQLAGLNPSELGVIARTSAMTYRGTSKPVAQIGKELGVQYILEGSVRTWGDRVRISAQLIQVSDQTHLWAENYDRDSGDVLTLQGDVSHSIAQQIRIKLEPQTQDRLASPRPVNPEAYEAYLKGRYFWNKRTQDGLNRGIEFFQRSLQLQPNYAPAYVGLADSYFMLAGRGFTSAKEAVPKAKTAAVQALQINRDLGEAHATLAHIQLHDWDWAGLDDKFQQAIALNPANAYAYYYYSEYLMAMGRPQESIAMVKKIQQIDPVSPVLSTTLGSQYYLARQYDTALELIVRARELYPDYFLLHYRLAQIDMQRQMKDQAIEHMQEAVKLSGQSTEMLAALAQAYAFAGMRSPMQDIVDQLDQRARSSYVSPYYIARIYGALGDKEQAFAWLDKAYDERCVDMIELRIEPAFDGLHSDPRFSDLLRRVGWSE